MFSYCRDRRMMAPDFARFMNGAGKIHERIMNRKKKTLLPFHEQFMNESDFWFCEHLASMFMNKCHSQCLVHVDHMQEKSIIIDQQHSMNEGNITWTEQFMSKLWTRIPWTSDHIVPSISIWHCRPIFSALMFFDISIFLCLKLFSSHSSFCWFLPRSGW